MGSTKQVYAFLGSLFFFRQRMQRALVRIGVARSVWRFSMLQRSDSVSYLDIIRACMASLCGTVATEES